MLHLFAVAVHTTWQRDDDIQELDRVLVSASNGIAVRQKDDDSDTSNVYRLKR